MFIEIVETPIDVNHVVRVDQLEAALIPVTDLITPNNLISIIGIVTDYFNPFFFL